MIKILSLSDEHLFIVCNNKVRSKSKQNDPKRSDNRSSAELLYLCLHAELPSSVAERTYTKQDINTLRDIGLRI